MPGNIKISVIGAQGVGKTTIINQFCYSDPPEKALVRHITTDVSGEQVPLEIHEHPFTSFSGNIWPQQVFCADVCLIVVDAGNFDPILLDQLERNPDYRKKPILLVVNKMDCAHSDRQLNAFKNDRSDINCIEVSALKGVNINRLFKIAIANAQKFGAQNEPATPTPRPIQASMYLQFMRYLPETGYFLCITGLVVGTLGTAGAVPVATVVGLGTLTLGAGLLFFANTNRAVENQRAALAAQARP